MVALEHILYALLLSVVQSLRYSERKHITHGDCYRRRCRRRADPKAHLLELMYGCREQNGVRVALKQRAVGCAFV